MCPTVADHSEQSGCRNGLFKGSLGKRRSLRGGRGWRRVSRRGDAGLPLKGEWTRQVPHVESPGAARVLVHACVCVCVRVCAHVCVCSHQEDCGCNLWVLLED